MVILVQKLQLVDPKHKSTLHVDTLPCRTKQLLLAASHMATQAHARAAEELYKAAGNGRENFQELVRLTSEARRQCEKARIALEKHRTDHGCM
jgi:hypothetical protein